MEKIVLEVVSFSEVCDVRYDEITKMIEAFSEKNKQAFDEMKKSHEAIRTQLANTAKNIIVEIEDHAVRDELLSLLTSLDSQSLDRTVSDIVEKLIQRIRDLLLKNRRLNTINTEQNREVQAKTERIK